MQRYVIFLIFWHFDFQQTFFTIISLYNSVRRSCQPVVSRRRRREKTRLPNREPSHHREPLSSARFQPIASIDQGLRKLTGRFWFNAQRLFSKQTSSCSKRTDADGDGDLARGDEKFFSRLEPFGRALDQSFHNLQKMKYRLRIGRDYVAQKESDDASVEFSLDWRLPYIERPTDYIPIVVTDDEGNAIDEIHLLKHIVIDWTLDDETVGRVRFRRSRDWRVNVNMRGLSVFITRILWSPERLRRCRLLAKLPQNRFIVEDSTVFYSNHQT